MTKTDVATADKAPNFEMARSDNPTEIILAAQRSFVRMLKDIVADVKKDSAAPGLTWDQLDYLLDHAAKKEPTIILQSEEM